MKNKLMEKKSIKKVLMVYLCALLVIVLLIPMVFSNNISSYTASDDAITATQADDASNGVSTVASSSANSGMFFDGEKFGDARRGFVSTGSLVVYPGSEPTPAYSYKNNRFSEGYNRGCNYMPCDHMVKKVFSSQEAASKDFALTYGRYGFRNGQEYGSTIYKITNNIYGYTYPEAGKRSSTKISRCLGNANYYTSATAPIYGGGMIAGDAVVHSHPSGITANKLSGADIAMSASMSKDSGARIPIYVATPSGELKRVYGDPNKESYYRGFWFSQFTVLGFKNEVVASNLYHGKWDSSQLFKYKHWFSRRCSKCA